MGSRPGLRPGARLNGIYEIERLIAVGGMGEVYKGRAIETGDAVAIKTIRPELATHAAALSLFRKEAAALHNLFHEAIVRYYVFSVDPEVGSPYLAMEYVDGQPLSDLIRDGPLPFEMVRILQRRLAGGLQAAHELGIVHRDVSPDNVILPSGNVARAKIIDFGIARSTLLGEGTVIGGGFAGKSAYVSPEQAGLFGGDVTAKSDIYSLGLVLAEALTGNRLDMGGNHAQVVEKRRAVPDLSGVDARMRPLIERMLQPRPGDRIATMAEVAVWQPADPAGAKKRKAPLAIGGIAALAALAAAALAASLSVGPLLNLLSGMPPQAMDPPVDQPGVRDIAAEERALAAEFEERRLAEQRRLMQQLEERQRFSEEERRIAAGRQAAGRTAAEREGDLLRLTAGYDPGACGLLVPAQSAGAGLRVDAYGPSWDALAAFMQAFKEAGGSEQQVVFNQLNELQCPAIAFLKGVRRTAPTQMRLRLDASTLAAGEPLRGSVEGFGPGHVEIVLVGDDGYVYNLSDFAQADGGRINFATRVGVRSPNGVSPLLVIAIASVQRIPILGTTKPANGAELFPLLLEDVKAQNVSLDLAVAYSRIGR
jgi:serine/threonine-protein kinase